MIDLVTVVFRDELSVLRLQAESVEKNCTDLGIKNIYVMVNDDLSVARAVDPAWWGSLADRVRIVPRQWFGIEYSNTGWLDQQLLKILGSSISYNTWSMILDAKTIIIKPLTLPLIFANDGRLTTGFCEIRPVFNRSKELISELFDIELTRMVGPGGVPFMFNNSYVRQMIGYIEQKQNSDFARWFLQTGMITEFMLYAGYIQWRFGNLEHCYSTQHPTYLACNVCHSETQNYDNKFKNMADSHTVSVHRNCWSALTAEQQQRYVNFLLQQGITRARELCEPLPL